VLEGSVRRDQNRVRVKAQLIDAHSGAHLWADQFDATRADLLQMQDEIVARISHALGIEFFYAGALKSPSTNPDAQDLAIWCFSVAFKAGLFGKQAEAGYRLCEQALDADPNNVDALDFLAIKFYLPVMMGVSNDPQSDVKRADELASRALALDANYSLAHFIKGQVLRAERRLDDAIAEYERALALDPSGVAAMGGLSFTYNDVGQYEKAIEFFDKAIRLSPRDPDLFFWYYGKSWAYFALQQDDRAIEWARRSIAINPNFWPPHSVLSLALALTGHEGEARDERQRNAALFPFKSIAAVKASRFAPPPSADPRVRATFDRLVEGLRKAGVPEE
jgi:tetratricopeptide (TPR) repeat protein